MQGDIFAGKWHQFKGKIKEKWGKLTDDDLTRINGSRERLLGSLQERYGWEKKRAEDELKRFEQMYRKEGMGRMESEEKGWEEKDETKLMTLHINK